MRITFVSWENPSGKLHGGGVRKKSLGQILESLGHEVCFYDIPQRRTGERATGATARLGEFKRHFFPLPFSAPRGTTLPDRLQDQARDSDLVISALPFISRELSRMSHVRVWTDFWDSWYRMAKLEASYRSGLARQTSLAQARALARVHREVAHASVATTYAGYGDYADFQGDSDASWLPTAVMTTPRSGTRSVRKLRGATAGFIANFHYWPNQDAATVLTKSWLPRLRSMGVSVVVAGFGCTDLSWPADVTVLGEVEDLADFYGAIDVSLVPVRRGGGVKVKAIESLLWGVPAIVDDHVVDGFSPEIASLLLRWPLIEEGSSLTADAHNDSLRVFQPEHQATTVAGIIERLAR
ncbi:MULTISPECIES: glycosyltransferase family 4 protein [unclassified Microbacterium]|uniref:glycosyltransferase n=1 Tax=unclassified Microbacterium TaxID=2609290 RepID=UPI002579872A|nr:MULTISPECIES: glycosyltransferase family 4 protein [unclassified Microbacterium]